MEVSKRDVDWVGIIACDNSSLIIEMVCLNHRICFFNTLFHRKTSTKTRWEQIIISTQVSCYYKCISLYIVGIWSITINCRGTWNWKKSWAATWRFSIHCTELAAINYDKLLFWPKPWPRPEKHGRLHHDNAQPSGHDVYWGLIFAFPSRSCSERWALCIRWQAIQ